MTETIDGREDDVTRTKPAILVDEHVDPEVLSTARLLGWFRILLASKDVRFRGRSERDYIKDLRALNIAFLTQDGEFVRGVIADKTHHAGIVWLSGRANKNEVVTGASVGLGRLYGLLDNDKRSAHDFIIKVDTKGLTLMEGGRTVEFESVEQIGYDLQDYMARISSQPLVGRPSRKAKRIAKPS